MKKLFIITLAVLFLSGAAYAVEYDFSGMINTRGTYISNSSGEQEEAGSYMDYDMEFDASLGIRPTEKDLIFLNWEIQDKGFDASPLAGGDSPSDDNIFFKKAYGSHKFDTGTKLDFGLMSGGSWATAFGDNGDSFYRVKVVQTTGFGAVIALVEKNKEMGSNTSKEPTAAVAAVPAVDFVPDDPSTPLIDERVEAVPAVPAVPADPGYTDFDAEADDGDTYALALITKVGDINIKPLLKYVTFGHLEADEETDLTVTALDLGVDGSFGAIGFEAEFIYASYVYNTDTDRANPAALLDPTAPLTLADDEDYTKTGAYLNVWTAMDALEIGGMLAYGSYDKDGGTMGGGAGFGMGFDFGPGHWVMDWDSFGSSENGEYFASTLVALYGSFSASDAMSFYGCVEYMMSNEEETYYEGATGTVLSANMAYSISDNVTYSIGGATGQFTFADWDNAAGVEQDKLEADPFTRAFHKITISF